MKQKKLFTNKSTNRFQSLQKYLLLKSKESADINKRMVEELKISGNETAASRECKLNEKQEGDPDLLSKWKKSAARFQPSCKSHLPGEFPGKKSRNAWKQFEALHDREVLDAAEALTYLSRAATNRT